MVAPAGAGPCPQITCGLPWRTSWRMTGTSPPGPLRCGSTTWRVKAVATAASKALPPFSNVAMPTAVAIQCVEATTPNVPSISGRVVNGFGLMALMTRCVARIAPRQHPGREAATRAGWRSAQARPAAGRFLGRQLELGVAGTNFSATPFMQ
jgi:hypothetical protein